MFFNIKNEPTLTLKMHPFGPSITEKDSVKETMIQFLADYPIHLITCDNGNAFAAHEGVAEALNATVYFAHPYVSWKRDTNFKA